MSTFYVRYEDYIRGATGMLISHLGDVSVYTGSAWLDSAVKPKDDCVAV